MIDQLRLQSDVVLVLLAPDPQHARAQAGAVFLEQGLVPPVCYGRVLRTGPRVHDVEKGDCVCFPPSAGDPFDHRDYQLLLIRERDIAFVLEPTEES